MSCHRRPRLTALCGWADEVRPWAGPVPADSIVLDGIRMKVSEKGAVSVYWMGLFPVTV
jgi:hypothetical protein